MQSGMIASLPYLAKWFLAFPISWLADFSLRKGAQVTVVRKICNTIGMWGPAMMLMTLCLIKSKDQVTAVVILVLAVGINSAIMCGSEINEMDICPNHAGMLASILNTCGKIFGFLAPIVCGIIVPDQVNKLILKKIFFKIFLFLLFGNFFFRPMKINGTQYFISQWRCISLEILHLSFLEQLKYSRGITRILQNYLTKREWLEFR